MPGETALTRMPSAASSLAIPIVSESMAPLEAAYQTYSLALPREAATDEMLTMVLALSPGLCGSRLAASRATHRAPRTLMSMQSRIVSVEVWASLPDFPVIPALLTTCEIGPTAA